MFNNIKFLPDRGQTMIEVIIALTLIILFLSGVVVVELYAVKNADYSRSKSISTQLARQQLERARVVRDSAGIGALSICQLTCYISYINDQLIPVPISPTGQYGQSLTIVKASIADCLLPTIQITPQPTSYKATATVLWGQGDTSITPAPQVVVSSCLTDWR